MTAGLLTDARPTILRCAGPLHLPHILLAGRYTKLPRHLLGGSEGGGARRLTLQPIRPKLRLIWHMSGKARRVRLAALLLGMIFLVAQCHFCSDLSVYASASSFHFLEGVLP